MLGHVGAVLGAKITNTLPAASPPNANGLAAWLQGNALKVLLCVIGLGVIAAANRAQLSKVIKVGVVVVIGMLIIFGQGPMKGLATWLGGFFGGGGA